MIEYALSTYLKSRPSVSAIVGSRVYDTKAPQTSTQDKLLARIVYKLMPGSVRHYHSTGASGLVEADIELTFTAKTIPDSRGLYEAVRNEIDGFQGVWGSTSIDHAFLSPPASASGDPTQGDAVGYPSTRAVLEVAYQESIPVPVNE